MKSIVSAEFQATCPNLSRNYAFPQNLHTKKIVEITIFYVVNVTNNAAIMDTFDSASSNVANIKTQHRQIMATITEF